MMYWELRNERWCVVVWREDVISNNSMMHFGSCYGYNNLYCLVHGCYFWFARLGSGTRKLHKKVRCIRLILVLSDSHYDICLPKLRLKHLISTFMIGICDDNMIEAPISLLFPFYLWNFPTQKNPLWVYIYPFIC